MPVKYIIKKAKKKKNKKLTTNIPMNARRFLMRPNSVAAITDIVWVNNNIIRV